MIAAGFSLLLSALLVLPASFVAPKGWTARTPPASSPVDFIWLSPGFGVSGNGENLTAMSHPVPSSTTLGAVVHDTISNVSDRTIVNSHSESTCHGRQAGWTFDARLPLPNGKAVSQIYHLTIVDGRAFAFIFTHTAGVPVGQAINDSIQSICPGNNRVS